MSEYRKLCGTEMNRLDAKSALEAPKHPVILLLDNIRSMWNVGAMFRTADAAGIEKIILTGYTAVPPRKEIDKTALGAQDTVCWEYCESALEAVATLKASGVKICALEIAEPSRPYTAMQKKDFPLCLVVGNEVDGIGDELLRECDEVIEIPQYGAKHSLNVAVAAGVSLFEFVRVIRATL
ncbi:MAG: RNA methyltransferase [Chlorobiaceae bacterium]|nr:RNA methyltransferase [Chlorobiaceae bacterium]NTW63022.1 RNA methyltransferase [Chlorobiaceae bacterium]